MSMMMRSSSVSLLGVRLAGGHLGHGRDLVVGALGAGRHLADVVLPRVDVLELGVAGLLDEAALVAVVVRHHRHRRVVEALDQAAQLLVDGERHRPAEPLHPAALDPGLGLGEQRAGDLGVVDGVEEAEHAGVVMVDA